MADDFNKKILIDIEVGSDGQEQINQYKAAFDSLRNSINGLSSPLTAISGSVASLDKDISRLAGSIEKLDNQNKALSGSGSKVKDSVNDLGSTFKVFKDVIEVVKTGAISLEQALSGGLAILVTLGPEILKWAGSLFKGKDAIDKTKMSIGDMNEALQSSDYSNAIQQMNQMKINVGLAKKGFLDKKEVLQQYNDTLGKTMGKASNLNEVEAKMTKDGGAYIKMTLQKAIAQLALEDAAKKAYQAEQARQQSDDDALSFWDKTVIGMKHSLSFSLTWEQAKKEQDEIKAERHKKAMERRAENVADFRAQSDAQLAIAAESTKKAADIAKTAGYDFLSGDIVPKEGGANDYDQRDERFRELTQKRIEAANDTEKMIKDSLSRQVQATYESYGSETAQMNSHFQDELTKLNGYLSDKLISRKQYDEASKLLETEYHSNLAGVMNKYDEQDKNRVQQAQNELAELQIKGMHEGAAKQIAELQQEQKEKNQQFDKLDSESLERINKLAAEISDAHNKDPKADTAELAKQLDAEYQLMVINSKKKETLEQQTADAISKIKNREVEGKKEETDQKGVNNAQTPEAKLEAEKKLILDKYQFEVQQAQGNEEILKKIEEQKDKQINELSDKFTKEKNDKAKKAAEELKKFELQQEKKLSEEAFSIINQSIKQEADAKIAGLERDKEAELNNSSLTSAQKLAIEQKFKQQEAQVKIKAFKQEQEASIAQAVINGALAITKGTAQTGVLSALYIPTIIAETAVEIAKIAAQKPPAYASGGVHYSSDGRGGVLAGYSKTDNTNAWLRSGEGIIVSEAMRVPWARNLVSAINVGFGGRDFSIANPGRGYAVGGIFTDGGDANRYYNQPMHDQKNLANSIAYQMINNFPPVYVDVKDINNQQNILAQTINRVNL
ncbi:MAG TPA: hypothetical protein VFE53_07145 [Mucilaginibacter sp.]|jgi:hypothetical protein|nr:hypothetical protein [Mucilaginibacter sp.]